MNLLSQVLWMLEDTEPSLWDLTRTWPAYFIYRGCSKYYEMSPPILTPKS